MYSTSNNFNCLKLNKKYIKSDRKIERGKFKESHVFAY